MMETDVSAVVGVVSELRVSCGREVFVSRLAVVSRAVSTRSTVQVLAGIRLVAGGGELELAATDMELSLRTAVPATVTSEGSVVVPGKLLSDLARLLPPGEVALEVQEASLNVTSGSYASRLHTYAAEDFPRLPPSDLSLTTLAAAPLLETIDRVSRSASRDESRPVLTGILVRFEGSALTMAATDSYRLSMKET